MPFGLSKFGFDKKVLHNHKCLLDIQLKKVRVQSGTQSRVTCQKCAHTTLEALEKSKVVKQTKVTTFFTVVEQNPGPSGQKFSKPLLEELNEALKVLSDED